MNTTRYFEEQVLRKRPYLTVALCETVLSAPLHREDQDDGRVRFWGSVTDPRDGSSRYLRVITLADGRTIHNAFFDRDFVEVAP
jgi:hypothetical protein